MSLQKIQFLILFIVLGICRICAAEPAGTINSFDECAAAGNKILRSYPARCYTADGTMFSQDVPPIKFKPKIEKPKHGAKIIPKTYQECVSFGYPVVRTNPPKCTAAPELVFTKEDSGSELAEGLPENVETFFECKEAGFLIKAGNPDQCITPEGIIFFDESAHVQDDSICKDLCGDGVCQEMVCMGEGCPCPENSQRCKQDCQPL